jgi:Plavaka transposase
MALIGSSSLHRQLFKQLIMAYENSLESQKPGMTILPVIISSDKMQLMLFHDKMAYPIYLTISNIPKDIR